MYVSEKLNKWDPKLLQLFRTHNSHPKGGAESPQSGKGIFLPARQGWCHPPEVLGIPEDAGGSLEDTQLGAATPTLRSTWPASQPHSPWMFFQ